MAENVQTFPAVDPDLDTVMGMMKEQAYAHFPTIEYYVHNTPRTVLDEYHLEASEDEKTFADPVTVHCFLEFNPNKWQLIKYGMDVRRDLVIHVPTPILLDESVALATQASPGATPDILVQIGDQFVFNDERYEVLTWTRDRHWGPRYIPLYVVIVSDRVRGVSTDFVE